MTSFEKALEALKKDGVIIFPTETTLGIGCRLTSAKAIRKLYYIKKREPGKPTAIVVATETEAEKYAFFDPRAKNLTEKFWPGPLTLVLKAKPIVPREILGPNDGIGIRIPSHPFLLKLLKKLKEPILAPSANFAGEEPPLNPNSVDIRLAAMVDYVVDDEVAKGKKPSTVLDLTSTTWSILREGPISLEQITTCLEEAKLG